MLRERGKIEKKYRFGHKKNHKSAAVRGARAGCAPPGSASVTRVTFKELHMHVYAF